MRIDPNMTNAISNNPITATPANIQPQAAEVETAEPPPVSTAGKAFTIEIGKKPNHENISFLSAVSFFEIEDITWQGNTSLNLKGHDSDVFGKLAYGYFATKKMIVDDKYGWYSEDEKVQLLQQLEDEWDTAVNQIAGKFVENITSNRSGQGTDALYSDLRKYAEIAKQYVLDGNKMNVSDLQKNGFYGFNKYLEENGVLAGTKMSFGILTLLRQPGLRSKLQEVPGIHKSRWNILQMF